VFNGDFVDRGKRGLEVLLLLLSLYLAFPNAVFLNRGNHEDSVMNARYGFIREVESKYPVSKGALEAWPSYTEKNSSTFFFIKILYYNDHIIVYIFYLQIIDRIHFCKNIYFFN